MNLIFYKYYCNVFITNYIVMKNIFLQIFIMKKVKKIIWFTLIELLLVITIIWIIALWLSQMNFNASSDKQKNEIFTNKIISNFEEVRNYSLLWKWIWVNLDNPEKWKVEFSTTWSWNITSYYFSWAIWTKYNENLFWTGYEIKNIECISLDNIDRSWNIAWTWIIEIIWPKLTLTWACNTDPSYKKLLIDVSYKNNFENNIEINTVNWLISILK